MVSSLSSLSSRHAELPADCVTRVRAGNVQAFELLYRAMHGPLCLFAMRYVGDTGRAEELVQELFLDLWANRASWTVRSSVRAYLFTALRNRALNVCRRDDVESDWADDEARTEVRALHPSPTQPDDQLETAELHARLSQALAALPKRCGLVMHLRWRDGLSYAEIAQVLGISTKGVENQLARGLRALQQQLGKG